MTADITTIQKLFEAVKASCQKQHTVINSLNNGDVEKAVSTAYTNDALIDTMHNYLTSIANHGPNATRSTFASMAAKKAASDFAKDVGQIGIEVKKDFEDYCKDYLNADDVKYKDGSIIVYGHPIADKVSEVEKFLDANKVLIINNDKMSDHTESLVNAHHDQIQDWFTNQILIHDADYSVDTAIGHNLM